MTNTETDIQTATRDLVTLFQSDRIDDALRRARSLSTRHPHVAVFHNIIGAALTRLGDLDGAIVAYRTALELDPDYAGAHNNLANAYRELNRPSDALNSYAHAARLDPLMFDAHYNLGFITQQIGQFRASIDHYTRALELSPLSVIALQNLALTHSYLGNTDAAIALDEKALALCPDNGDIHYNLSKLKNYSANDPHIFQMRDLLASPDLPPDQRAPIGFALSNALGKLHEVDACFQALSDANQAYRARHPYDIKTDQKVFAALRESAANVTPYTPKIPPSGKTPIFIVGMPRSGTSLVEHILAGHDRVFGAGELYAFTASLKPRLIAPPNPTGAQPPGQIAHETPENTRKAYFEALDQLGASEPFITDKMPLNFRWIGPILEAIPEAKIIHVTRDPVATCWSCYQHYFSDGGLGFTFDLHDLAAYFQLYRALMETWNAAYPTQILNVSYESLTENPAEIGAHILTHCGLDWQEGCLDFSKKPRMVRTLSANQVHQGIYRHSSEAWKAYAHHLAPLL